MSTVPNKTDETESPDDDSPVAGFEIMFGSLTNPFAPLLSEGCMAALGVR